MVMGNSSSSPTPLGRSKSRARIDRISRRASAADCPSRLGWRPMLSLAADIYRGTRKKHDLLFNLYVMRPIAALVVALAAKTPVTPNQLTLLNLLVFVVAAALLPFT